MRKLFLTALAVLFAVTGASAQVSIPNAFVANTRIISADVNENFTELGDKALNREGGTATGDIIFSTLIRPDVDGGAAIGSAILQFSTGYFQDVVISDELTVAGNLNLTGDIVVNTLTVDDTSAVSIDTAGGITAGTPSVAIIGTDGKIPALSSTYFASLTGVNLTGLLETNITDGAILARLAASETITGAWKISNTAPLLDFNDTNSGVDEKYWRWISDTGNFYLQAYNDALNANTNPIVISRFGTGTTVSSFGVTAGTFSLTGKYDSATTQPGFFAYSATGISGADDGDDINFSNEVYDTAGNLASGVFTAPVTGIYHLCYNTSLISSGSAVAGIALNVQSVLYRNTRDFTAANIEENFSACYYVQMSATDTARVEIYEASSETFEYGFNLRDTTFSGRLVP